MKINSSFLIVVIAISGLMIPTSSMNTFAASDDTGTVIANKASEIIIDNFWEIIAWYLTLAESYEDDWELAFTSVTEPEKTKDKVLACTTYGKNTMEYIYDASGDIDAVNADGTITEQEIEDFANNHPELIDSTTNWAICTIELKDIWDTLKNIKEIAFINAWLVASDVIYEETGLANTLQEESNPNGPDLNTIRRDQAALEALFTLTTAELLTGEAAAKAATAAADAGEDLSPQGLVKKMAIKAIKDAGMDAVKDIGTDAAKEAVRANASEIILKIFGTNANNDDITSLVNAILSPSDVELPPYLDNPRKITEKFRGCMVNSSLDDLLGCATTLYTDVSGISPDFSTLQTDFENCEENIDECTSFFGEKFGPSLDEIKKIGKIIECVEFKGNVDDCSSVLHIDKKLYSVVKECTTTNNESNCLNSMMDYTGFGDKIACVADTTDTCMASDGYPPSNLLTQYEDAKKKVSEARAAVDKAQETYDLLLKKLQDLRL